MKIFLRLAKWALAALGIVMLATPVWAQTMHSGERTDDFTGIRRNMTPMQKTVCSDGKMAVGSTCVEMVTGGALPPSWVKNFLGETKCSNNSCAYIYHDGNIRFSGYIAYPSYQGTSTYAFDVIDATPIAWNASFASIATKNVFYGRGSGEIQQGCWSKPFALPVIDSLNGVINGWNYIALDGYNCSVAGDPNWRPGSGKQ